FLDVALHMVAEHVARPQQRGEGGQVIAELAAQPVRRRPCQLAQPQQPFRAVPFVHTCPSGQRLSPFGERGTSPQGAFSSELYGRYHWMISIRLPSGSVTKKRSAPGMGVVSSVGTPRSCRYDRAAAASRTRRAKCRGLRVSAWSRNRQCSCWLPRSNHITTK